MTARMRSDHRVPRMRPVTADATRSPRSKEQAKDLRRLRKAARSQGVVMPREQVAG